MGGFHTRPESHPNPNPPSPDSSDEIGTLSTYEIGTFSTVATSITGDRNSLSLELERLGHWEPPPNWYSSGGTVLVQINDPLGAPTEAEGEAESDIDYQSDGDGPFSGDHDEEADQPSGDHEEEAEGEAESDIDYQNDGDGPFSGDHGDGPFSGETFLRAASLH